MDFQVAQFTAEAVCQALDDLGIARRIEGADPGHRYAFKSLRRIESHGIYYVTADAATAPGMTPSIILAGQARDDGNIWIVVDDSQVAFYRLMQSLVGPKVAPGIDPLAVVHPEAVVSGTARIGPFCVIGRAAIGHAVNLTAHVVVMDGCRIDDGVTVEPHSTIGATGVAWAWDRTTGSRVIQPQVGFVHIEEGCFLGSDVSVVRGSVNETTRIGRGTVIAHGSKIGHGCELGAECHLANNVSLAGNVTLGSRCFLGSGVSVRPQTRVAANTVVGAGGVVVTHQLEEGWVLAGMPARAVKHAQGRLAGVPDGIGP